MKDSCVERILGMLDGVRRTGDGWDALCPCPGHGQDGDHSPSLRVAEGDDGRVLLKCRVGCSIEDVIQSLGLEMSDLFPRRDGGGGSASSFASPAIGIGNRPEKATDELCHRAYSLLLEQLELSDDHRKNLKERGFTDGEIQHRGYKTFRSVDRARVARAVHAKLGDSVFSVPGYVKGPHGVTLYGDSVGLLIPVRDTRGQVVALKVRRATDPKYIYVTSDVDGPSPGNPVHVPLGTPSQALEVRVTKGELKSDICFCLDGLPTISCPGVTAWASVLPVLRLLGAKTVVMAFDAPDLKTKAPVLEQTMAFSQGLLRDKYAVEMEVWHE